MSRYRSGPVWVTRDGRGPLRPPAEVGLQPASVRMWIISWRVRSRPAAARRWPGTGLVCGARGGAPRAVRVGVRAGTQ